MEPKGVVAASQPRWIPVTERLPEKEEEVLAYSMGYGNHLDCYKGGEWTFLYVTHWMPLPEPPKKDNPELIGGVGDG